MIKAMVGILLGTVLTAVFMAAVHKLYREGVDEGIVKEKYSDEEENSND